MATATTTTAMRKMLIDGKWCEASNGRTLAVTNPATEETVAEVAFGSRKDCARAVAAAAKAMPDWMKKTAYDRAKVRDIDARVWVSFHHVGVIEDRAQFLDRLDRFAGRIGEREQAMLDYLREPRSLDEMIAHRFLYPEHATFPFIDSVERRTIDQHLARLSQQGRATQRDERWVATHA